MPEMSFDWDGLINLVAFHLYREKRIFVRELIQNAHDAVARRRHAEPAFGGRIDVRVDLEHSTVSFSDNGIGMDAEDLHGFLSTVGMGETRQVKDEVEGLIGHFGIGFLSAFVVAKRVEVRTRKLGSATGWLWTNSGSRRYDVHPCDIPDTGTVVTVYVSESERAILQAGEISSVVKRYADMLLVPVHLNGAPNPLNTGRMPWERGSADEPNVRLACLAYLEARMSDSVLEIIPISLEQPQAVHGVLYISSVRVFALDSPRTVECYLKRMLVTRDLRDILPEWASFVNGVLNVKDLQPTAARDDIVRDSLFAATREALSLAVIKHLAAMRANQPERLSQILHFHAIRIRAACLAYDDFFDQFVDLIEWRVNSADLDSKNLEVKSRMLTIPQLLERLGHSAVPVRLLCFASGNDDHFFRMANSANALVVAASDLYEMDLLEKYARRRPDRVTLVRADREDDDVLFRPVHDTDAVCALAGEMSSAVTLRSSKLNVTARAFDPPSLPAILRSGDDAAERERAYRIHHDPRESREARELAGALLDQPARSMRLTLNAANPFVRRLATLPEELKSISKDLLVALYNSSFLTSGNMTQHNAEVLHDDFVRLLGRNLDYLESIS